MRINQNLPHQPFIYKTSSSQRGQIIRKYQRGPSEKKDVEEENRVEA